MSQNFLKSFLFFLFFLLFSVYSAYAAKWSSGERVDLDEIIQDDLYSAGEALKIRGSLKGDAHLFGGQVDISSPVGGDLNIICGEADVSSVIKDDLHIICGSATITGDIRGDLMAMGGQIHVPKDVRIFGGVYLTGGELRLEGEVKGPVRVYGGMIHISGKVGEDLTLYGGDAFIDGEIVKDAVISSKELAIGQNAKFGGNVRYWAGEKVDFGASLAGGEAVFDLELEQEEVAPWRFGVFLLLFVFGAGLFSIFILNRYMGSYLHEASSHMQQNFFASFGIGILYILAAPVVAIFLMFLVVTIPFGALIYAIYGVSWLFAWPLASLLVTIWISERSLTQWNRGRILWTAFGIYVAFVLLWWVPVIGWLACLMLVAASFGALIELMRNKVKTKQAKTPQL